MKIFRNIQSSTQGHWKSRNLVGYLSYWTDNYLTLNARPSPTELHSPNMTDSWSRVYVLFQKSFMLSETLKLKCAKYLTFNTMKDHFWVWLKRGEGKKGIKETTLLCLIVGEGFKLQIFGKKTQVHLTITRELLTNTKKNTNLSLFTDWV